jgi:hypothetical protein
VREKVKKIFIFASILVPGIIAGITQLQAARHTIAMAANIGGVCTIGAPTANNGFGSGGTSMTATATDGKVNAKSANMTLPFSCSSTGVSIQLTSANQGITMPITASLPSGQINKIHYIAKFNVGSSANLATLNTANASATAAVIQAGVPSGDIHLDVDIASGASSSNTLIAGNYADSLHVDVLPNP